MNIKFLRHITVISCFIFATSLVTKAAPITSQISETVFQSNKYSEHKVAKGETVYSIARMYNVAVNDIYVWNPSAESGIKSGDKLKIPVAGSAGVNNTDARTYTVKSKETLYSIAKQYGVKVENIIDSNPELKTKPLYDGQILRIPSAQDISQPYTGIQSKGTSSSSQFQSHKVEPQETIYGIARKYNTTPETLIDFNPSLKDGLKTGATVVIPVLEKPTNQVNTLRDINTISVGIVLPFVNKSQGQSARFVEYYEGFLMALSEMKAKGLSANVYVFDMGSETGTKKLKSLLDTYEMKYLDMIIGGISSDQISVISDFAKKQNIKYVIPFPTKATEVQNNPQVFQINAPHSVLYADVANTFINIFRNVNVIYLKESGASNDRSDFISALNQNLPQAGMIANAITISPNLAADLSSALDRSRRNVIIPMSASSRTLQNILPALNSIVAEQPATQITLFGHTDWQTYPQFFSDFSKFDTYIYSPFYLNNADYRSNQFVVNYQKWYNNKSLINTYPKYGVLGYDTGICFLSALSKYGKDFSSNVNLTTGGSSLQTPFLFKKVSPTGGYMNTRFYLVHFKRDGSIDKTEYGR